MNQYELALVVNAKIEDEARLATLEAVKELITRFGGNITNVDDWGKKRLAYEIQKMKEGYYYFIQSMLILQFQTKSSKEFVLWKM